MALFRRLAGGFLTVLLFGGVSGVFWGFCAVLGVSRGFQFVLQGFSSWTVLFLLAKVVVLVGKQPRSGARDVLDIWNHASPIFNGDLKSLISPPTKKNTEVTKLWVNFLVSWDCGVCGFVFVGWSSGYLNNIHL